jgi:hypothetical protein
VHQARQRHEHEANPNDDAPDILAAAAGGPAEGQDSRQHQRRADERHVEGEQLRQERRADVGAQHHGQRGGQRNDAGGGERGSQQSGGGTALQQGGDPQAGEKSAPAAVEIASQPPPQNRTESTLHPRAHHMRTPEE